MIQLFKMALRDLARNRRRTFFSALALGMGLALLLLIAATIEGEMRGSMESSIRLQSGHLQVRAASYDENKMSLAWEDLIENPAQVAGQVAALPPVQVATPRLFASGIVASGDETAGVRIIGIDPPSPANAPYRDGMVSGEWLGSGDRAGVLIGVTLADRLGLKVGDAVNVLINTSNGDVDQQTFTIQGIYTTHTPGFDESTVFLPLDKAQAFAGAGDHASSIFVLLNDRDQTGAVAAAVQSSQYRVLTFEQMNEILVQTEALAGGFMVVIYLIVLAITATVIVNTLIMSVFERTREIGILSAIGMKGRTIMALFFIESSLLAVGGIAMGLVLGGLLVAYASTVGFFIGSYGATAIMIGDTIHAHLSLDDAITLPVIAFVITLIAALYPARMAARMEPVEALRGGK